MGNSYTRQAGASNIANGNIIDATDLNSEFDALDSAFNSSTGHTHDGSGNGAPIVKTGPGLEFIFNAGNVTPKTSGTNIDIGTASLKFNNANFKGTVSAPTFTATSGATIPSLTVGSSTAVTSVDADLSSVSASHDTLASAKAIKTYIDSQVTAQDLDISDGSNTGSIDLDSQTLTFTGGTGITTNVADNVVNSVVVGQKVTISTNDSAIVHDSLSGFVAAEHVDHSGVSITAGNGLTGGGTIEATRTLTVDPHTGIAVTADGVALSHLGLESLADPDADRVAFWDDSEGAFKWLEMGSNLAISGTTLNATDTNTTYSTATTSTLGLVKLGSDTDQTTAPNAVTTTANRSYAIQLDSSDQMVVNVPWTDTTYSTATSSALGLVKLGSDTEQSTAAESVTSTASRTYAVQLNGSDQMVVNVPWVDTNDNTTYTAGTGLTLDGTTFNANVDATTQTVASETVSATASRTYAVQVDSSDNLVVNVPWSTSATSPASYTIDAVDNIILDSNDTQYFKSGGDDSDISAPMFYFQGNTPSTNGNYPVNIRLYNNSPNPSSNTDLGRIAWHMDNSAGDERMFVGIDAYVTDYTALSLDSRIEIFIRSNDNVLNVFEAEGGALGGDTYIRSSDDIYINSGDDIILSAPGGNMFLESGDSTTYPYFTFRATEATDRDTTVDIEIRNRDTVPADGQTLGQFRFTGEDDNSAIKNYVTLEAIAKDVSPATQDGTFKIKVFNNGSEVDVFEANDAAGHTVISAGNDIYLKANSDNVIFQGLNSTSAQIDFAMAGSSEQYIKSSGTLKIFTSSSSSLTLNTTFSGANLTVAGALSKGSGSFKIDHPLPAKTETHHLVHSFIEGPQADLIYRGRAELVDGTATVNIDTAAGMTEGTFVVLCRDVQCFTSNESGWTAVKGSVSGNTLTITAQDNTCTDTISWMVVGERKDQHMIDTDWTDSEGHVIVEPEKPV